MFLRISEVVGLSPTRHIIFIVSTERGKKIYKYGGIVVGRAEMREAKLGIRGRKKRRMVFGRYWP